MSNIPDDEHALPAGTLPEGTDLTRHANFALLFGDGTSLRAHRTLLKLASPVMQRMFEDVRVLLCAIHPVSGSYFRRMLKKYTFQQMARVVTLANKYAVDAPLRCVDDEIQDRVEAKIRQVAYGSKMLDRLVDDKNVFDLLDWSIRSGLDLSFERCMELMHLLHLRKGCFVRSFLPGATGFKIGELSERLIQDGFTEKGLRIMKEFLNYVHVD